MKKTVLAFMASLFMLVSASAQDNTPAYRAKGYKGNVSITSMGLYWNGAETSHGYMFNDRFYLGAGAGLFAGAVWDLTLAARVFADTRIFWRPRESTPTTGMRLGYLRNFYGEADMFQADITFGWSWGLASRYGISFDVGLSAIIPPGILLAAVNQQYFSLAPVLSVSFEF